MAQASTSTYPYPLPPGEVARGFPKGAGDTYDQLALAWSLAFYAGYGAVVAGWLPVALFVPLGVCAFVRNFNALHEGFHAQRQTGRWRWARHVFVVTSPFMLGYHPLRRNHIEHHTWAQQPERDPDAYLAYGPWWLALWNAFTQPEQGFVRYVARKGWSREVVGRLLLHSLVFAAVCGLGGWEGTLVWLVVTRIGNTASWFIFDWILHQEWAWHRLGEPGIPSFVRGVWSVALGRDNLLGVEYHYVHHLYPTVPGWALPQLAEKLEEPTATA